MTEQSPRPSILVIIPPPVWALAFFLTGWLGGRALDVESLFQSALAGWPLFALGFAISAAGRLEFARAGTEVIPVSAKNTALVTTGPFRLTRNPMYLGILIATFGLAVVVGVATAYLAPVVFFVFVNFISIPYEEEKMERQFGDAYRDYKARVRRWI